MISTMDEQNVIEDWLNAFSSSIKAHDIGALSVLASPKLMVFGLPENKELNYRQWCSRWENELAQSRLHDVRHTGLRIKTIAQRRLAFATQQSILAHDRTVLLMDISLVLEREEDDQWRLVEQQILKTKFFKLPQDTAHE